MLLSYPLVLCLMVCSLCPRSVCSLSVCLSYPWSVGHGLYCGLLVGLGIVILFIDTAAPNVP